MIQAADTVFKSSEASANGIISEKDINEWNESEEAYYDL